MTNKFTGSGGVAYYYTDNSLPFSWNPAFTEPFNQNTALGVISRVVTVNPTTAPYGRQSFNCTAKAITDVIISVINTENNLNPTLSTTNGVSGNGSAALPLQMSQSWLDGKYRLVANTSSTFVIDMATSEDIINNRTSSSTVLPITSLPFVLTGTTLRNTSDIFVLHKGYYSEWPTNSTITLTASAVNYVFFRLVGNAYQLMSTTSTSLYNLSDVLLGTVDTTTGVIDLKCKILWDGFEPTTGVTTGGLGTTQCVSLAPLITTFDIGFYNNSNGTGSKLTSVNEGSTFYLILKTTNIADGTEIPISFSGTANAADFGWSSFPTSIFVTDNIATLGITATNDSTAEGDETLIVSITSEITTGTLTIVDTSDTPAPVYTLARSTASINEGESVTFTLTYTDNVNTGSVSYSITGVQAEDIDTALSGSFSLPIGSGTRTWTVTTLADGLTEGTETMTFSIASMSLSTSVTINDTSKPSYSLSWRDTNGNVITSTDEGSDVFMRITYTGAGSTVENVYIDFSGTGITQADFASPTQMTNYGPFFVSTAGSGQINANVNFASDGLTEGNESVMATLKLADGTVLATSSYLTIVDYVGPTYTINIYTDSAGNNLAPTPLVSGTDYWAVAKTTNVTDGTPINFVYEFDDGEDIDDTGGNDAINGNLAARQITTGHFDTNVVVKLRNGANNTDLATASRTITPDGYILDFADYTAYADEAAYDGSSILRLFIKPNLEQMLINKYGSDVMSLANPPGGGNYIDGYLRIIVPSNVAITGAVVPYLSPNPSPDYAYFSGSTGDGGTVHGLIFNSIFNLRQWGIRIINRGIIIGVGGQGGNSPEDMEEPYVVYDGGDAISQLAANATVIVNNLDNGVVSAGSGGGGGNGYMSDTPQDPTTFIPTGASVPVVPQDGNRTSWTNSNRLAGGGGYPYGKGWVDGCRISRTILTGGRGYYHSASGTSTYDAGSGGNGYAQNGNAGYGGGADTVGGLAGKKFSGYNVTFTGNGNVLGRD